MGMKAYKVIDLFGHTNKLPPSEHRFFDTFLEELDGRRENLPFQRLFTLESLSEGKDRYQSQIKLVYDDKSNEPQSFLEWKSFVSWTKLGSWRQWRRLRKTKIYILPVGPFPDFLLNETVKTTGNGRLFDTLVNFGNIFFPGINFCLLPVVEFKELGCKTRYHTKTGQLQILLSDVLKQLERARPKDAYGIVAVPWVDLYPSEEENHIMGEGTFITGCAALGFSHYASRKTEDRETLEPGDATGVGGSKRAAEERFILDIHSKQQEKESTRSTTGNLQSKRSQIDNHLESDNVATAEWRKSEHQQGGKWLRRSSEISLQRFSHGLKIPPLFSMHGVRSLSYTDLSSCKLMKIDKELTCSFQSLKELDRQTKLSSSSWLQLFSDNSSGFSSSFEDFEIINTNDETLWTRKQDDFTGESLVIDALPLGSEFVCRCTVLWRLFRALSHEVCHLFGLSHCLFYRCAMNKSHSVTEADNQPLFLCPVCLRKLQRMLKFNINDRYVKLARFLVEQTRYCKKTRHLFSPCTLIRLGLSGEEEQDSQESACHFTSAADMLSKIMKLDALL